jgi:hypothetical protein
VAGREREVKVTILGDSSSGQRALAELNDHTIRTSSHFDGLGSKLASFGKVAAVGLAGAAVAAGAFLKSAVDGASDLAETVSKSNTIFGDQGKAMEQWANGAAKAFGQTKQGALDAAATFGNLFVQLGTGSGEAAKMSREMVVLASDFASFHNADPTDVIESMTAAFRGEYDSVQRFVPTINAATVEAKALEMGLAGTTKELTAQDKALATQALLISGAGAAMGDFGRTSDGLANRQRILSAEFTDMKDRIGTALLPVVLRLMEGFMGLGDKIAPVVAIVQQGFAMIRSGFVEGNVSESTGVMGAFVRLGEIAHQVVDWVVANWPQIQATVTEVLATVQAVIMGFVDVVLTIWNNFGEQIVSYLQGTFSSVMEIVGGAMDIIQGIVATVTAIIHGDWSAAWEGIKQVLSGAWDVIVGLVHQSVNMMQTAISIGMEILGSIISSACEGIVNFVASIPGRILDALGNLGSLLFSAGQDLIWGMLDGIKSMAGRLAEAAKDVARGAVNAVKGFLGIGSPSKLFMGFGVNIGEGLALGMGASKGTAARAGAGLAAASVPGFVSGVSSRPSGGVGAGIVINVAGHVMTERDLVDVVQSALLQKQRRVPSLGFSG